MSNQTGIYEIMNNEGMICYVDTATAGKQTYGEDWADICKSALEGRVLKAKIEKYQYRTHEGEPISDKPTGFVVKINENIEAFLPFKLCGKFREPGMNYDGETVAVMVESFDPNSLSIIVRELIITDQDFDVELVNEALGLIGQAHENGKYIRGTIIAEKKKWSENENERKRVGFLVTINGIEAFLPVSMSFYSYGIDISYLIGTNILAGIEEINIEKMSITLSMKTPYENMVMDEPLPMKNEQTIGLVTQVTSYEIYVLLPQNVMGLIPRHMFPSVEHNELLNLTGTLINCIPFKVKRWDEINRDLCMLVSFLPKGD